MEAFRGTALENIGDDGKAYAILDSGASFISAKISPDRRQLLRRRIGRPMTAIGRALAVAAD